MRDDCVDSEQGKGSTFHCYFPVSDSPVTAASPDESTSEVFPAGHETILVVEDEELLRELLRTFFESKGYRVICAVDGVDAMGCYERHSREIDVVVSDIGLPNLGGDELYRRLKSLYPGLRMILASGFVEPELKAALMNEGVNEFISKPYRPSAVERAIRTILDHRPDPRPT